MDERQRLMKIWLCGGICWHDKITDNKHLWTQMAIKFTTETNI